MSVLQFNFWNRGSGNYLTRMHGFFTECAYVLFGANERGRQVICTSHGVPSIEDTFRNMISSCINVLKRTEKHLAHKIYRCLMSFWITLVLIIHLGKLIRCSTQLKCQRTGILDFHTRFSHVFHLCLLVPRFPLQQLSPLPSDAAISTPAVSTPAVSTPSFLTLPLFPLPRFQSSSEHTVS